VSEADLGDRAIAGHGLLLGLAGVLPDSVIARSRDQLAAGTLQELARNVMFCVLSQSLKLTSEDAAVLADLLDDPAGLGEVEIDDSDVTHWQFGAEPPEADPVAGALDQVVSEALVREPDVIGCWQAWRTGTDEAAAKAVFVIEVRADTDLVGVTARMQQRLAAAGEASPQVEVYPQDWEPPAYQRQARGFGRLIWAAVADPGIRIASIFDEVDPRQGPLFSSDHPLLDSVEADQVAKYLSEAEPVLVTTARMDDVVDTGRLDCVPINFRTDGSWLWTEAAAYYAQEHLLEPDPDLLAHIRSNHHTIPEVDGVAVHRALETLMQAQDEPIRESGG
jgi:hypothetical protein